MSKTAPKLGLSAPFHCFYELNKKIDKKSKDQSIFRPLVQNLTRTGFTGTISLLRRELRSSAVYQCSNRFPAVVIIIVIVIILIIKLIIIMIIIIIIIIIIMQVHSTKPAHTAASYQRVELLGPLPKVSIYILYLLPFLR